MKKKLLPLIALTMALSAQAQSQYYKFSEFSSPYTELANPVVLDSMVFAEGDSYFLPLQGETFNFYGIPFPMGGVKTFLLEPNGNLRIDNDSALIIIDGAFTWLDSIDLNSSISYLVEGTSGNRVLKAQWKNLHVRVGDPGNYMNLQIWVYQASGVVEIHYGPSDSTNRSGFGPSDGPQVGIFFARDDFSKQFEKLWVNGSPSNLKLDSARNFVFKAMSGIPEEGTVFRFTPWSQALSTGPVEDQIRVYPNPAHKEVHFEGLRGEGVLSIYDITGKQVQISEVGEQEPLVNISSLGAGCYFWTWTGSEGRFTGRLEVY